MIPYLSIPVLNNPARLRRCVDSIDFPVGELLVVNNGNLDLKLDRLIHSTIQHVHEEEHYQNFGVAGSWNLAMHHAFNVRNVDAVLICGDDVLWAPGDLQRMWQTVQEFPEADCVFGNHSFSNFIVKRSGFEKVGWFWEELYPAYWEDGDFWTRARLSGAKMLHAAGLHATHEGSATIKSDPKLEQANKVSFFRNAKLYAKKWGNPIGVGAKEVFTTPYNQGGPLDAWELSPERLAQPHFRTTGTGR